MKEEMEALTTKKINIENVLKCHNQYTDFAVDHIPTHKKFILSKEEKIQDEEF